MLHSSNCESFQQGSSIPLSQPRISLNPVIPTVISDIPCILSIPNLAPICFLFLNTGLQLRQIPHPEKSTEDPQNEAGNPDCYLWHPASRIPYPVHTFNIKSRPYIALKSRSLAFKWGESRIPKNLLTTLNYFHQISGFYYAMKAKSSDFYFLVFLSRNTINRTPLTANTKNGLGITRPRSTITGKYLCHFQQTTSLVYTKSSSIRLFK